MIDDYDPIDWHGEPDCSEALRSRALIAAICLSGIATLLIGAGLWRWLA